MSLSHPGLRVLLVVLLVALVPLAYTFRETTAQPTGRLAVVTSSGLFVDLIQRVGGDGVEAFSLVPAGADPHTFQPTPQDVRRATRARVAVWNGLGLDETSENAVAALNLNLVTVTLTEGIEPIADEATDPHDAAEHEATDHADGNPHM
jgi:manganese/iron transport system substrate-binding protein